MVLFEDGNQATARYQRPLTCPMIFYKYFNSTYCREVLIEMKDSNRRNLLGR